MRIFERPCVRMCVRACVHVRACVLLCDVLGFMFYRYTCMQLYRIMNESIKQCIYRVSATALVN